MKQVTVIKINKDPKNNPTVGVIYQYMVADQEIAEKVRMMICNEWIGSKDEHSMNDNVESKFDEYTLDSNAEPLYSITIEDVETPEGWKLAPMRSINIVDDELTFGLEQKAYVVRVIEEGIFSDENDGEGQGCPIEVYFHKLEDAEEYRMDILNAWTEANSDHEYTMEDNAVILRTDEEDEDGVFEIQLLEESPIILTESSFEIKDFTFVLSHLCVKDTLTVAVMAKNEIVVDDIDLSIETEKGFMTLEIEENGVFVASLALNTGYAYYSMYQNVSSYGYKKLKYILKMVNLLTTEYDFNLSELSVKETDG